jgi:mannose-6-phosphate isomerase-like protein (cupin superfamily)
MPITLDGDCRVVDLREGEPVRDGALRIWNHFEHALSLRVLELDGNASLRNESADEVLYVIAGSGTATIHGRTHNIKVDDGIYVPPNTTLALSGVLTLVSSQCAGHGAGRAVDGANAVVSMNDRPQQRTGDRWYREVVNDEVGSTQVTQFVGSIPPGRAPDHYHLYEEVICILEGEGAMWAGSAQTPIRAGSCIFLPRGQVNCVENRGSGAMRLLGVFYPAGSPAVRYGASP